jgi:hypothetical protein
MLTWAWDVSPDGSRVAVVGAGDHILILADGVWREVPVAEHWDTDYIAWTADGGGFLATCSSMELLHITTAGPGAKIGPLPSILLKSNLGNQSSTVIFAGTVRRRCETVGSGKAEDCENRKL